MEKYAVIVAGGSGQRMGASLPKQFLLLQDRPVLWYTLQTFLDAYGDLSIILALPEAYMQKGQEIVQSTTAPGRVLIIPGGHTRFHSVQNGLQHIQKPSVVFVHDGVRCLLSATLIHRCYETAVQHGSAIPVVDPKDSIRLLDGREGNRAIERRLVKLVQTPQTFLSDILLPAYKMAYDEAFSDDAMVVEASGHAVHLVEGEENNIKITRPADLALAAQLLDRTV